MKRNNSNPILLGGFGIKNSNGGNNIINKTECIVVKLM